MAFDLDKNKFVGAAEIRHVLVNIGEQVYRGIGDLAQCTVRTGVIDGTTKHLLCRRRRTHKPQYLHEG